MKKLQTILLTGATGFLGSYLLEALLSKGHKVVILKRSTSDAWRIESLLDQCVSYDIDTQSLELAFDEQKIDAVIHTACSYERKGESISDIIAANLTYGLKLLDACLKYNTRTFFNTDTLLKKNLNNYALSKAQFVEWLKKYSDSVQCINLKPEHMYGFNDDNAKFVYWLLDKMFYSEETINLTSGDQMRDFIHVTDVVSAYMLILDKLDSLPRFVEFDVCTDELISVKDFVLILENLVKEITGVDIKNRLHFGAISYRPGEVMEPKLSNAELKSLGWKPKIALSDGLKKMVGDFKR
jgi:CDP-paratose synthetase